MSTVRFTLIAAGLFAMAFVGISWASKGFPVMAMRVQPLKPDARIPTFEESVKQGIREDWKNSKTAQSDGDKVRDKLRLALWQASIGYKLSPCDATMKKNLIEALTNYTNAWAKMAACTFGTCTGDDKRMDVAAAAFKTPADARVHQALGEAFEQGGIGKDDFPRSIRNDVFMWTGMPFDPDRQAACIAGRTTEARR